MSTETTTEPRTGAAEIPVDPILAKSYSLHIAIAMLAVVGATVLAVVDEVWTRRPYKHIQGQWKDAYTTYLDALSGRREAFVDDTLKGLDEYKALDEAATEAEEESKDDAAELQVRLDNVTAQSRSLGAALKDPKARIAALGYQAEHAAQAAGHEDAANAPEARGELEEIAEIRATVITYTWLEKDARDATPSTEKSEKLAISELIDRSLELEETKATVQQELGRVTAPASAARKAREKWLDASLGNVAILLEAAEDDDTQEAIAAKVAEVGVSKYLDGHVAAVRPKVVADLRESVANVATGPLGGEIRQIHIAEARNWVDRCETCHLGAREPIPVTEEGLRDVLAASGWSEKKLDATPLSLFATHPNPELLKAHDPERFGCSMCHNGNGVAMTTVEAAHGLNKHWLLPLHPKENLEAGCLQCHRDDRVLPMGERITAGRDSFHQNGCWGCHKYDGFDPEPEAMTALENRLRDLDDTIEQRERRAVNLKELLSTLEDEALDHEGPKTNREAAALRQEIAELRTEAGTIVSRLGSLYVERQRVGPNLKDVKVKVKPEWLTDWIRNPHEAHTDASGMPWRPDTKMPVFRWADDDEVKDVAAFVWQSAYGPDDFPEYRLPSHAKGDAAAGETTFMNTGCLACHSIGRGDEWLGSRIAGNLSWLGEKNRFEYVVRWVMDPRHRLVPYSPALGKDVSASAVPADAGPLVTTQHTIMPNFRLSETEARNVATFLLEGRFSRREGVEYEPAPWLEEKERFERGKRLVLFQGCAGCHEIRGLEKERGIGTELTAEGSKPLERLDFGHLTIPSKRGEEPLADWKAPDGGEQVFGEADDDHAPWYRPRGFFMHKLAKPDVFDIFKYLPDRWARLRMPQFRWSGQEIHDLTTFLLGSVESQIPETLHYTPEGRAKDIQDGWWVVRKYNCEGCHQITPGQVPSIQQVPHFAEAIAANQRDRTVPPSLVLTGFRTQPDWLAAFLRDPSLGGGRQNPKSSRPYLPVRMPTFDFSEDEIRTLVRFFDAMASQPTEWREPMVAPLTPKEHAAAKAIFDDANCAKCHVVEGQPVNAEWKAPKLDLAATRLRPDWIERWIKAPDEIVPGTAMPALFKPAQDGDWEYLNPDLAKAQGYDGDQVRLMVRYLYELSRR